MIIVIHHEGNKDPDIYYGMDQSSERKLIRKLSEVADVSRSDPKEWYGQDNPNYAIHHYDAKRRRR